MCLCQLSKLARLFFKNILAMKKMALQNILFVFLMKKVFALLLLTQKLWLFFPTTSLLNLLLVMS